MICIGLTSSTGRDARVGLPERSWLSTLATDGALEGCDAPCRDPHGPAVGFPLPSAARPLRDDGRGQRRRRATSPILSARRGMTADAELERRSNGVASISLSRAPTCRRPIRRTNVHGVEGHPRRQQRDPQQAPHRARSRSQGSRESGSQDGAPQQNPGVQLRPLDGDTVRW